MKKIVWLFILIFVLYILAIFKAPILADEIEKLIWINWFNNKIRELKEKLDSFSTKVPTKEKLQDYYSWAVENIEKTKENIDTIRKKAKDLEETYNEAKETIDEAQEKLEQVKETIDKVSEVWESINKIITTTWTVN